MTAPVGSGGGADLGTARGKVRIDYESSGTAKAVKDVEGLKSSLNDIQSALASGGKGADHFGAQIKQAADLVAKYTSELEKAKKRQDDMAKAGLKGQQFINAKGLTAGLDSALAQAKKQLDDWKRYVASVQPKLPAPKADTVGVASEVNKMKAAAQSALSSGGGTGGIGGGGAGFLTRLLGLGSGGASGSGISTAGAAIGSLAAKGIASGIAAGGVAIAGAATAALGVAVAGIGYTLTKGFQRLTALDTAAAKLKALGYSAEQVKAVSASALEAVKGTAFGLDEAFQTAASAIAAGIKPGEELTGYLKTIADNAALAGISMQEMGYLFGKVATTGKLQGDEMNTFMERNIDVVGNLAKELNKPRAAIKQMVTDGEIDFATFQRAMNANAGAAKTMGNSITGSFQNLKASISRIGAALLAPLFGQATGEASTFAKAIQWVTAQLGKIETWLGNNKEKMIDFWANAAKGAIGFAEAVTHAVGRALQGFKGITDFLADLLGAMAKVDEIGGKFFGGGEEEAKTLRNWQKGLRGASDTVDKWGKSAEGSTTIWDEARKSIDDWAQSSKDALKVTGDLGDKTADSAVKTQSLSDALENLQLKTDQVSKQLEGTNEQFAELLKTLKDKKAPQDLIDTVIKLRSQFENGGRQAKNFADAVRDFGDKSSSASDQADKLISSLQGLGLLPGADNLREYNKALAEMTKYDNNLIDLTDTLGSSLINLDGTLNTSLKNGATLEDQISSIRKEMVQLVASGEATPEEAFNRTAEGLRILLSDAGITGADAEKVINKYLPSPQTLAEALKKNVGGALGAAGMDPMQVDTELQLITQADDIIGKIVGPDGKLHVPTVLDPTMQAQGGAPTYGPTAGPGPQPGWAPKPNGTQTTVPLPTPNVGTGLNPTSFTNAVNDPAVIAKIFGEHADLAKVLQPIVDQAQSQGTSLSNAFAQGILTGSPEVRKAIEELAALAADGLGHSPAKYGPLSGKGWTFYRGQTFTQAWAEGIESQSGAAQAAVSGTAQAAVQPFGDQIETMVKDLQQWSDLGKHLLDFANQISSIAFGVAGVANTLSGGKLFPKTYVKSKDAKALTGSRLAPWQPGGGGGATGTGTSAFAQPAAGNAAPGAGLAGAAVTYTTDYLKKAGWAPLFGPDGVLPPVVNQVLSKFGVQAQTPDFHGSLHGVAGGSGYAVDIGSSATAAQNEKLAQLIMDTPEIRSQVAQLIFQGPSGRRYGIAGGADVSADNHYYADQWSKHMDHLHLAVQASVFDNIASAMGMPPSALTSPGGAVPSAPATAPATGTPAPTGGPLTGQQNIADYIISKAMSLGYSRQQANYFATQAFGESGFNPLANGGNQNGSGDVRGIFQFTPDTWGNRPGSMTDAKANIDAYFDLAAQRGLTPGSFTDPTQLGTQVSIGGPYHPSNVGHRARAEAGVAPFLAGFQPGQPVPVTNDQLTQIADNTAAFPTALDSLGLPGSLRAIADQDQLFRDSVAASRGQLQLTDDQVVPALQHLDGLITDANNANTPESKAQAQGLESIRSSLMSQSGLAEGPSTLEQAQNIAGGVSGIASDVFETFDAALKAVAATKNLTDTMVRGVANTGDIFGPNGIIDNLQSYITLASKIFQTAGDITSFVGQFTQGGGGFGDMGATQAAGQLLSLVGQALAAVNTAIDIGQEIYTIGTKYLGRFLTSYFGFPGATDIKYLLDTVSGQMQVYSSDNPQLKHTYNTLGRELGKNYPGRQPPTNNMYIYQGPGQDPRDTMNDAMFTIKSSSTGAFGYANSGMTQGP